MACWQAMQREEEQAQEDAKRYQIELGELDRQCRAELESLNDELARTQATFQNARRLLRVKRDPVVWQKRPIRKGLF